MKAKVPLATLAVLFLAGSVLTSCPSKAPVPESTLDAVKARRKLIAGVKFDFKPFGYLNEKGENVGFDIEIAEYIAKKLDVPVEFQKVTSESRIPDLLAGKVDLLIASMTHTQPRDTKIDFTITYFQDGQSLLVQKGSQIRGLEDLPKKTVAAVRGATSGLKLLSLQPQAQLLLFNEYPEALKALQSGMADALTTDRSFCIAAADDDPNLEVTGGTFTVEPYGIGVRENDSKWRDFLNEILMQMEMDGTYAQIYWKHFQVPPGFEIEIFPGAGL